MTVPWHKVNGHSSCPASKPWAVVKNDDGEVEGCHATEADANKQLAALNANEETMSQTHPPDIDVVRTLAATPTFRAASGDDDGLGVLYGHFSVFNTWYEVDSLWEGKFLEQVAPGSYEQTIAEERAKMRILFDHGFDPQIGSKVLAPVRDVHEDKIGGYYEGPLFDTAYNRDLLPGLKEGVYGASMRMRVLADAWDDEPGVSDHNPKGLPERTITRASVPEFGPVTFPASPTASANVRSTTDQFYDRLRERDSRAYKEAVRAAGQVIDRERTTRFLLDSAFTPEQVDEIVAQLSLTGRPGARSAGGGDTSGEPGNGELRPVPSTQQRADHDTLRLLGIIT